MQDETTKELVVLKTRVSTLEKQAESIVIDDQKDYTNAVDLVSKLKEAGSQIKAKKDSIIKPLLEATKQARDLFAPIEKQFANAESIIKTRLLTYKRRIDEEAAAKEVKIAARVESGNIKLETGERKMAEIERVDNTTRGKVGQISIRKVKKVRITDESVLPRAYLKPDEVAIRRDALSGIAIPGVEVYEEEQVAAGSY